MLRDRSVTRLWALSLVALPLAIFGQWQLDQRVAGGSVGWALLGAAALLFVAGTLASGQVARRVHTDDAAGCRPWKPMPVVLGAAASLGSYAFFADNRLTMVGFVLWQGGLLLFVSGVVGLDWLPRTLTRSAGRPRLRLPRFSFPSMVIVALMAVGAVFRLWEIGTLPAEPGVDLPLILLNVEKVLDGEWPIFFTLHPGREGLYMYLAAGHVRLFGLSYPALRTVSALIGVATIPVAYWAGRRLFSRNVGVVAAGLLAVSRWHIILSRTGLRFVLMPLFSLLLVAVLDRAIKSRRPGHWVWVGLVLGWGFHTYNAWWVMPAVVAGGLLLQRLADRDWRWQDLALLGLALALAVMVMVPLIRFAHDDPQMFSMRIATRVTSREQPLPEDLLGVAVQNFARTVQMFNYTGDGVAHINVALKRQLGLVSGALFVLGAAFWLARWREHGLALLVLCVTSLPTALALAFPHEVPNAGRASGAIGLACLAAAIPLVTCWDHLRTTLAVGGRARMLVLGVLVAAALALLTAEGLESRDDYFVRYRWALPGGNYPVSTRLAEAIGSFGVGAKVYLKAYPYWYDGNALCTQLRLAGIAWENELTDDLSPELMNQLDLDGPTAFVLHPADMAAVNLLNDVLDRPVQYVYHDHNGAPAFLVLVAEDKKRALP